MTPGKPNRALWVGHGLEPRPQFHEKDPEKKERNLERERGESAKFWAPPSFFFSKKKVFSWFGPPTFLIFSVFSFFVHFSFIVSFSFHFSFFGIFVFSIFSRFSLFGCGEGFGVNYFHFFAHLNPKLTSFYDTERTVRHHVSLHKSSQYCVTRTGVASTWRTCSVTTTTST